MEEKETMKRECRTGLKDGRVEGQLPQRTHEMRTVESFIQRI